MLHSTVSHRGPAVAAFLSRIHISQYEHRLQVSLLIDSDFWLKENTYEEQPRIRYKRQLLLMASGSTATSDQAYWIFGTHPSYNRLSPANFKMCTVQVAEVDSNFDGINDYLLFNVTIPLALNERIYQVQLALIFEYQLKVGTVLSPSFVTKSGKGSVTDGNHGIPFPHLNGARIRLDINGRLAPQTAQPHSR